jgi:hypothetical protein
MGSGSPGAGYRESSKFQNHDTTLPANTLADFFVRASIAGYGLVDNLYQTMSVEVAEQLQQVGAASIGFHIIGLENRVANLDHLARLDDQAPDGGPDRIEPEIGPTLEVENGGFAFEVAGNLISGSDYYRCG